MGEFIAWIIGWDLILEYAFGAVTVSASWSGYFLSLMHKTLGLPVSDTLLRFTKGPWEQVLLNDGVTQAFGIWNIPASVIGLVVAAILYRGMKESAFVNNLIVVIKVSIVLVFIALGISLISPENLFVNPAATGLRRPGAGQGDDHPQRQPGERLRLGAQRGAHRRGRRLLRLHRLRRRVDRRPRRRRTRSATCRSGSSGRWSSARSSTSWWP